VQGRVSDSEKHLMIEEGRGELNLQYMKVHMMSISNEEGKGLEEQAYSVGNSKISKLWLSWSQVIPV
jgi:hypothetical protein